jgi:FkbM family methyltransferase
VQVGIDHLYLNTFSRKLSLVPNNEEVFVDVGAWNGDTVVKFVDSCSNYRAIHAFEPVKRIFPKLKMRETYIENLHTYPIALSNFTGEIDFVDNNAIGSHVPGETEAGAKRVTCSRLDDILDEATMMKIEVEGHESKVLEGAAGIIKNCAPEICAQGYHYPLDPIRILQTVKNIHNYRHVAFRINAVNLHMNSVLFSDRAAFE